MCLIEKCHRGREITPELIMNMLFSKVTVQLSQEAKGTAVQRL